MIRHATQGSNIRSISVFASTLTHHLPSFVLLVPFQWMEIVSAWHRLNGTRLLISAAAFWKINLMPSTHVQLCSNAAGAVTDHLLWTQSAGSSQCNNRTVAPHLCFRDVIAHLHIASIIRVQAVKVPHRSLSDLYVQKNKEQRRFCVRKNTIPSAPNYLRTVWLTKHPPGRLLVRLRCQVWIKHKKLDAIFLSYKKFSNVPRPLLHLLLPHGQVTDPQLQ